MEYRLGIYEKAMPNEYTWRERLEAAKKGGFDFLEISVDESDARLARLEWSDGEIRELYDLSRSVGLPIETMCLSGHRKYPMGSGVPKIRARSMDIMKKAIRLADGLGVRIIQLAGYDVYYHESSTAETRERFIEGLRISAGGPPLTGSCWRWRPWRMISAIRSPRPWTSSAPWIPPTCRSTPTWGTFPTPPPTPAAIF